MVKSKKIHNHARKVVAFIVSLLLVSAVQVNASDAGTVSTKSGSLNVRSAPTTASSVVSSLEKGRTVTLHELDGDWWYAEYDNDRFGYLHADYIMPLASHAAVVSTGGNHLNVRSGPSVWYPPIDALVDGASVIVTDEVNGWSVVLYDGDSVGYVSPRYLKAVENETVELDVPSYKQYDSRWASMLVGSSGQTVKNIGCTLTCVAMAESYRKGTTVTPAYVVQNSSFTSGGAYYWKSNYSKSSPSDYLSAIAAIIDTGRPVIFHGKMKNGTSHWVIVTGYSGDKSSAANFTINDPGSDTRTTLADYLAVYPNYVKIAYYN